MASRLLVVEDERLIRWSIRERLANDAHDIVEAEDLKSGAARMLEEEFDLVLLDLHLPDGDGTTLLKLGADRFPEVPVIIVTAHGSVQGAVEAMKIGAYDYITKPFDVDDLAMTVNRALERAWLRRRLDVDVSRRQHEYDLSNLIGDSPAMDAIRDTIRRVADAPATTVFLQGESGTGKDLIARIIHYTSRRRDQMFMNINCTSLPDPLLESEVFGHERGAIDGSPRSKKGLFELADRGTVYLDEIADIPPRLQAKFLRVLDEKAFRRVGGASDITVDTRIIAATNKDLDAELSNGSFREDLFYRLAAVPIHIPPLRTRSEDVPALALHFLTYYCFELNRNVPNVTPGAVRRLQSYEWPGNVRELRNVMERTALLEPSNPLDAEDFVLGTGVAARGPIVDADGFRLPPEGCNLEDVERQLLSQALDRAGGNQTQAARLLGVTRDQVRYKIAKFDLSRDAAGSTS